MSLNERIEEDYKEALRQKNEVVVSTLRMLRAALKNFQIDTKEELNDENVIKIISSDVKKHKDSISEYEKGARADLAQKEKQELEILMKYMPEQMGEDEVRKIVKDKISQLGEVTEKDFGRVMGAVMGELKGKADGAVITKIVKEEL